MKNFGIVGLCVSVGVLGLIVWLAYGKKEGGSDPSSLAAASSASLGAAAPTDFASNPAAAKEHAQRQVCLASCAAELRTCKGTATSASATETCDQQKSACEGRCP